MEKRNFQVSLIYKGTLPQALFMAQDGAKNCFHGVKLTGTLDLIKELSCSTYLYVVQRADAFEILFLFFN